MLSKVDADSVADVEYAWINFRVDGMSRHGKVGSDGSGRSICVETTCTRSIFIKWIEKKRIFLWIYEDTDSDSEERTRFGTVYRSGEVKVYLPPSAFAQAWDAALAPGAAETRQVNILVRLVGNDGDDYPIAAYGLDEVPKWKPDPPPKTAGTQALDVLNKSAWIIFPIYLAWAAAKHLGLL